MENPKLNEKQLRDNLTVIYGLEFLGVRIEDIKEEKDSFGILTKQIYYYSVPESSTITVSDEEVNKKIKTSDDLMRYAKEALMEIIINNNIDEEDSRDEKFIEELKTSLSECIKFRAKVRKGEVWNKELGKARLEELNAQVKAATEYKEV